jgi:hypothetical protein
MNSSTATEDVEQRQLKDGAIVSWRSGRVHILALEE